MKKILIIISLFFILISCHKKNIKDKYIEQTICLETILSFIPFKRYICVKDTVILVKNPNYKKQELKKQSTLTDKTNK